MSGNSEAATVPMDFYCERTPSKSRVYVLLSIPDGQPTLQAVLTCADAGLAQAAAAVLQAAWLGGGGPAVRAEAKRIQALLPDAPAASLDQAIKHASAGRWPGPIQGSLVLDPVCAPEADVDDDRSAGAELSPATVDCFARSPSDARLADLPGKVVRVTSFLEVHVHEPQRLIAAALATGWSPFDQADEDDPADILGAVMALASYSEIPGADDVGNEMSGQLLDFRRGDELADWSPDQVTATFTTGWRLRSKPEPRDVRETRWGTMPDFAKLFPLANCECNRDDCDVCGPWWLTPRTADLLHTALSIMGDQAHDDLEDRVDEPVTDDNTWLFFDRLPRLTWRQPSQWRRNVARACDDLVRDLEAGRRPEPRCFAEELALNLAIDEEAPAALEMLHDVGDEEHAALPAHRDDYEWDICADSLLQDSDIMFLYDPGLDGIEDPDADLNRTYGIGDMRPDNWFEPFLNVAPRDPDRGYRR